MPKEVEFTEEAKEAIDLIEFIRENGGMEEYSKYRQAESFIKERGVVSPSFLEKLKEQKDKLRKL